MSSQPHGGYCLWLTVQLWLTTRTRGFAGDSGATTEEGYVDVPRPAGFAGYEGEGQGQQEPAGTHPKRAGISNVRPFAKTEERYS
jgi:hypothetical protein